MTSKGNLKKYIDHKGITVSNFCKQAGLSNGFLTNSGAIGSDKIHNILNAFPEISAEWLITGVGEMLKKKETPKAMELNSANSKANTFVADVRVAARFGALINNPEEIEKLPRISLPNAPWGLNVAFQIEEDSMYPTIRHSDYIAANKINNIEDLRDGYTYIIIDKDDGVLCKRLYRVRGEIQIKSDNPDYPPYTRSVSDILGFFKCFMRLSTDFRTCHGDVCNAIQDLRFEMSRIKQKINLK